MLQILKQRKKLVLLSIVFLVLALVAFILVLLSSNAPSTNTQITVQQNNLSELSFYRGGCECEYPVYEITITQEGDVAFKGDAFVEFVGEKKFKVNKEEYTKISNLISTSKAMEEYKYTEENFMGLDIPVCFVYSKRDGNLESKAGKYGCKSSDSIGQIAIAFESIPGIAELVGRENLLK